MVDFRQLKRRPEHVGQGGRYHADVQSNVQDCGMSAETWSALAGSIHERSVIDRFHPPWVEYGILTRGVETA